MVVAADCILPLPVQGAQSSGVAAGSKDAFGRDPNSIPPEPWEAQTNLICCLKRFFLSFYNSPFMKSLISSAFGIMPE
jgi:hypothetical protein